MSISSSLAHVQPSHFPVTSSLPSAAALVAEILVRAYGLAPATICRFHSFGLNDTFIVESDSTKYALRIYPQGWRSAEDIGYELDALDHLAAAGVCVATAVPRRDGNRVTTLATPEGDRFLVLFTFAPGQELDGNGSDSADFGRSCAQIHTASDDFMSPHKRFALDTAHLLDQPLAQIRPRLEHRAKDWAFVQALADRLRQRMDALPQSSLNFGFCHGDFHGGNVHREGGRLTHFDFDSCGQGCRAYDIAVYRWALRSESRAAESKCWPAYLAGYREVRKLSEADLAAVDLSVPIREIWLMGGHQHGGPRWGFYWLGEKYFDRHIKLLREMEAQYVDAAPLFATPW